MSENSEDYNKGFNDSKKASGIDDIGRDMQKIFGGGGLHESDSDKANDKGWEDGKQYRPNEHVQNYTIPHPDF